MSNDLKSRDQDLVELADDLDHEIKRIYAEHEVQEDADAQRAVVLLERSYRAVTRLIRLRAIYSQEF